MQVTRRESVYPFAEIDETETSRNIINGIAILVSVLSLVVNMLLYQGALDIAYIDLYFWPDPKLCLMSWIVVWSAILAVSTYGMASCFYTAAHDSAKAENIFLGHYGNSLAWGFVYMAGDVVVIVCLYLVMTLYGEI